MTRNEAKPTTYQRNLAKLPQALAPLIQRRQWCVWRWTQKPDGSWQKPPFMATQPDRHASTNDPNTWTDYPTALAAVQAGHADGLSYVLTKDDPFGAIDLDHCRDKLCSIDVWAQNFMQAAVHSYQEVTPSGEGIRIWGLADGNPINTKFTLDMDGKKIAAELFRRTNKALTITGYTLNPAIHELANVDNVFSWAVVWGERRKAEMIKAAPIRGNGFDSSGCKYGVRRLIAARGNTSKRSCRYLAAMAAGQVGRLKRRQNPNRKSLLHWTSHTRNWTKLMRTLNTTKTMMNLMMNLMMKKLMMTIEACPSRIPACRGSMHMAILIPGR